MSTRTAKPLADRERALENAFFHKVDDQLLQNLKERMARDREVEQLAADTGIHDQDVLQELLDLGFTPQNLLALWLVPLAQVAWADGHVEREERQAVLGALEQRGYAADSPVWQMFEPWLEHEPSEEVLKAWRDYARALVETAGERRLIVLRSELCCRAREVAEAAGGVFGFGKISRDEESVLATLNEALRLE